MNDHPANARHARDPSPWGPLASEALCLLAQPDAPQPAWEKLKCEIYTASKAAFEEVVAKTQPGDEELEEEEADPWFEPFRDKLYDTCVEVLARLVEERFFVGLVDGDAFVMFSVSDDEMDADEQREVATRLNHGPLLQEFLAWVDSWDV